MIVSGLILLRIKNVSDEPCSEDENNHFRAKNLKQKAKILQNNWQKHRMHSCFSTAKRLRQTQHYVTLHVYCMYCKYIQSY
jgi:hypothetical protein